MTGVTHPPRPQPTKETQVSEPPSTSLPPRREQGPTPSFNPTQTPLTTANDRSGPYQTQLRSPHLALDLLCPWTKEVPTRLQQRLHWNPSPSQREKSRVPRHSFFMPERIIQLHCARQCCRNPSTGQLYNRDRQQEAWEGSGA